MMNAGGRGDDVDDGVYRTDFVEVDLVDRNVVNLRFGVAEQIEGAERGELDGLCQRGGLDEGADGAERAAVYVGMLLFVLMRVPVIMFVIVRMVVLVLGLCRSCFGQLAIREDMELGAGDAAAVHDFNLKAGVEAERSRGIVQDVCGNARINQCAEEHISGDTGKAIERGDTHGGYSFVKRLIYCEPLWFAAGRV